MIVSTTSTLQDKQITAYHGIVTGTCIMGANVFRDIFAGIRDIVGGRSGAYEEVIEKAVIEKAKNEAIQEMVDRAMSMRANAIIGVDIDYETVGGSMLMVAVSGTAVTVL